MRERRCITREAVGMALRATHLDESRRNVHTTCLVVDGYCELVVGDLCPNECRGWVAGLRGCLRGVQRAPRPARIAGLARAAGAVGRGLRAAGLNCWGILRCYEGPGMS